MQALRERREEHGGPEPRTLSAAEAPIGAWKLVESRMRFGTGLLPGEIWWTRCMPI